MIIQSIWIEWNQMKYIRNNDQFIYMNDDQPERFMMNYILYMSFYLLNFQKQSEEKLDQLSQSLQSTKVQFAEDQKTFRIDHQTVICSNQKVLYLMNTKLKDSQISLLIILYQTKIQLHAILQFDSHWTSSQHKRAPKVKKVHEVKLFQLSEEQFLSDQNQFVIDCKCLQNMVVLLTNSSFFVLEILSTYLSELKQVQHELRQNYWSQNVQYKLKNISIESKQNLTNVFNFESILNKSINIQIQAYPQNKIKQGQFQPICTENLPRIVICGNISKHQLLFFKIGLCKAWTQNFQSQQRSIKTNQCGCKTKKCEYNAFIFLNIKIKIQNLYSYKVCSDSLNLVIFNPIYQKFKPVSLIIINNKRLNEIVAKNLPNNKSNQQKASKLKHNYCHHSNVKNILYDQSFSIQFLQQRQIIKKYQLCPIVEAMSINNFHIIDEEIVVIIGSHLKDTSSITYVWVYNIDKSYTMNWMQFADHTPLRCYFNTYGKTKNIFNEKTKNIYSQIITLSSQKIDFQQRKKQSTDFNGQRLKMIKVNLLQHHTNHQVFQFNNYGCFNRNSPFTQISQSVYPTPSMLIIQCEIKKGQVNKSKKDEQNIQSKLILGYKIPKSAYYKQLLHRLRITQQKDNKTLQSLFKRNFNFSDETTRMILQLLA